MTHDTGWYMGQWNVSWLAREVSSFQGLVSSVLISEVFLIQGHPLNILVVHVRSTAQAVSTCMRRTCLWETLLMAFGSIILLSWFDTSESKGVDELEAFEDYLPRADSNSAATVLNAGSYWCAAGHQTLSLIPSLLVLERDHVVLHMNSDVITIAL